MPEPEFTAAQRAFMEKAIKDAVAAANAEKSPAVERAASHSPERIRQPRSLTADLLPPTDYYLPVIDNSVAAVEPSKVRYPTLKFSDHRGDVEYDAWKMDMKLFFEEYSGNFRTGMSQVKAYFKCTAGEAKTIILQRMDPDFAGPFETAADVLRALDHRFHDHNRVQSARAKYNKLEMGNMSYDDFRNKFTTYATTGKISPARWFDDMCDKISPALKRDIRTEKYKLDKNYAALDELLAVLDRESRNIAIEERKQTPFSHSSDPRGILKLPNWRSSTPPPPRADARPRTPSPSSNTVSFAPEAPVARRAPSPALTNVTCFRCHKPGHLAPDCPEAKNVEKLEKKIAELATSEDTDSDDLSENS